MRSPCRTGLLWLACALAALGTASVQAQAATETVLHSFVSPPKGANPQASVIGDSAGNLYGTATSGGADGAGVVFKVSKAGHETVLYTFTGGADGAYPEAGVIRDGAGNIYGTTTGGGNANCYQGCGVVFKLDTTGHETVLYSFTGGADGRDPVAGVIRDAAGNLYGTTVSGGTGNAGVVYKLDTNGHETVLYNFTNGADGGEPSVGVIRDTAGKLYGTTAYFGTAGWGVVYELDTTGNESVLYTFTGGADGGYPFASVIRDSAGNLYGATNRGGPAGAGVVFKVNTAGQETVLYNFTGGADGGSAIGVIQDSSGNLYGTTYGGGTAGEGVVYKLDTAGQETVLYSFKDGADGGLPEAGVIRDSAGNLYGTTYGGGTADQGVVYKVDAAGQETVLYSFPGTAGGFDPSSGAIRDSAGNFYGTTTSGGTAGYGVMCRVDTAGRVTVLHSFGSGADGRYIQAGVIRDSAGNLYGTALGHRPPEKVL